MNEYEQIKEGFKEAMGFESPISRFEALIQVARQTDGSSLPDFMKERINKAISNNQKAIVGLLDSRIIQDDLQ